MNGGCGLSGSPRAAKISAATGCGRDGPSQTRTPRATCRRRAGTSSASPRCRATRRRARQQPHGAARHLRGTEGSALSSLIPPKQPSRLKILAIALIAGCRLLFATGYGAKLAADDCGVISTTTISLSARGTAADASAATSLDAKRQLEVLLGNVGHGGRARRRGRLYLALVRSVVDDLGRKDR